MAELPDPVARRTNRRALLALAAVQVCFGTFPVFGKIAMREVSPLVLASFRAVFGAIFLTIAARVLAPEGPRMTRRDRRTLIVLSLLGVAANQTLYIVGLSLSTATNATLLISTIPIFTLLIGAATGLEPVPRARLLGVPLALAGVLVLLDPTHLELGSRHLLGNVLITVNSACYALYLLGARGILARRQALSVIASVFRWGAIPVLLVALPDVVRFRPAHVSAAAWGAIAAVVLFATVLAYSLNAWGLARTDAATAAIFIYVQPLIAGTLAFFVLGERPSRNTFVAAALIFAGVALAVRRGRAAST